VLKDFADHRVMTHRSALLAAHLAAFLFGLTGIFGALIHADAGVITLGRAALAAVALVVASRVQGWRLLQGVGPRRLGFFVLTGVFLAVHWVTFFIAVKVGGVAVATLGFASFPAFIVVMDVLLFRERVGAVECLLVGLVTAGLALVVPSYDFGDEGTVGLMWGLASGFAFALLAVSNRRAAQRMDAFQVAFFQNLVVALLVLPFAGRGLPAVQPLDWLWLALLGVFCTALSQYLFVASLRGLDARKAGMIIALEPVYAIACAWALFGQQPSLRMLLGAGLVMGAIFVSMRLRAA
jgi:drug/metabolite transporter (DMT)-like permease